MFLKPRHQAGITKKNSTHPGQLRGVPGPVAVEKSRVKVINLGRDPVKPTQVFYHEDPPLWE